MLNRMIPKRRKSKRNDDSDLWNHVKQNDIKANLMKEHI